MADRPIRLFPPLPPIAELPDDGKRDLALDVVRAWSLFIVVFGHFLMQILYWKDEVPISGNTLASGERWPFATWLFQVMPLFFVAGGAVNAGSFERFAGTYNQWLWQRVRRLMQPTAVFLFVLAIAFSVISCLVPREVSDALVSGMTGPLWFLSAYILVTALTPTTSRWWKATGKTSIAALLAVVLLVDYVRLQLLEPVGVVNFVVAWLLVHQLGYWYREGVTRRAAWSFVGIGLAANVLLILGLHWYPVSLVGIPNESFSNMAPPTVILVFHSFALFGGFVLLAPKLRERFSRPRAFAATSRAALFAMTIYLWHMSVLVAWLTLLHAFGFDLPTRIEAGLVVPDGGAYWLGLIPTTIGFGLLVYVMVRFMWPLEFLRIKWFEARAARVSASGIRATLGAVLLSLSLLAISGAGFSGFPTAVQSAFGIPLSTAGAVVGVTLGLTLLRQPAPQRKD